MKTPKLTKWAKQYAATKNISQEVIDKAAEIARAEHRGYTNTNDLQAAANNAAHATLNAHMAAGVATYFETVPFRPGPKCELCGQYHWVGSACRNAIK